MAVSLNSGLGSHRSLAPWTNFGLEADEHGKLILNEYYFRQVLFKKYCDIWLYRDNSSTSKQKWRNKKNGEEKRGRKRK